MGVPLAAYLGTLGQMRQTIRLQGKKISLLLALLAAPLQLTRGAYLPVQMGMASRFMRMRLPRVATSSGSLQLKSKGRFVVFADSRVKHHYHHILIVS